MDHNDQREAEKMQAEYKVSPDQAKVMVERQKVYGPPIVNHEGIAQGWVGLLQPWALHIALGLPVPPHVVALMMAALKVNRCRNVYHDDNYIDIKNYLAFAEAWQRTCAEKPWVLPPKPHPDATLEIRWRVPGEGVKLAEQPTTIEHRSDGQVDKVVVLGRPDASLPERAFTCPTGYVTSGVIKIRMTHDYRRAMEISLNQGKTWEILTIIKKESYDQAPEKTNKYAIYIGTGQQLEICISVNDVGYVIPNHIKMIRFEDRYYQIGE